MKVHALTELHAQDRPALRICSHRDVEEAFLFGLANEAALYSDVIFMI